VFTLQLLSLRVAHIVLNISQESLVNNVINNNTLNDICILHQNIAGILSKRDEIEIVIEELKGNGYVPTALCFSETFLLSGSETNLHFDNYELASFFSRKNKKRGGVAILVKKYTNYNELPAVKKFAIEKEIECCGIEIVNTNVIIVCLYRTPDSNVIKFLEHLDQLLRFLRLKNNKKIVVCGDLNINILNENKITTDYLNLLHNYNMYSHINTPTRHDNCIDHIFSNIKNAKGETHALGLSDHDTAQTVTFKSKTQPLKCAKYVTKRDYCEENIKKFIECIYTLSFSEIYEEKSLENAFELFHDQLILFHDLCFPIIKVKITTKDRNNHWLTKSLKKCCTVKRKLYYQYRKENNNIIIKTKFTTYSRILRKCISNSQKNYNTNYIESSKNKCRAAWNVVKNTFNQSAIKEINHLTSRSKVDLHAPQDIAEEFNNYFIGISNNPTTKITATALKTLKSIQNTIFLSPTNPPEIYKIILSLKNTPATGYDKLPTKILKTIAFPLSIHLSHLINLSLEKGTFPTRLKKSIVKPVFKKGETNNLNNYRPITLIPVLSKIYEKAYYTRLDNFLTKNNILRQEQNGFRKNKSTTLACFKLNNQITECIDKGIPVGVLFLDMSKAFDTVCHKRLLGKLERYGIRGPAYSWIESYLNNREQCTEIAKVINDQRSTFQSCYKVNKYGVPQGSILGPLLFLAYINDLPDSTKHNCILFADDTTLVIKGTDINNFENEINTALRDIIEWLELNNLQINVDKTKFMLFKSYKSKIHHVVVKHNLQQVEEVTSTVFLGMTLDTHCNWKEHVNTVCIKLNKFMFALWRIKRTVSFKSALLIYHGYIMSILRYGVIMWGNSVNVDRAFVAQKKCFRTLCGVDRLDPCKPLFIKHKLLSFPCLYIYEICIFVKLNVELFTFIADKETTRSHRRCRLALPTTSKLVLRNKSAYCMCIKIFNKIPAEIKKLPINKFKTTLYKILVDNCFYSINEFLLYKF
jgi:hypothetical protein